MKAAEIRKRFLDFFIEKGHKLVPSSSLVPAEDPTLLFTNAGMNQFKDVFEGKEKREYTCATSSQKCVRAGGKHNDLDNVGYTTRHHTFFEMLGNFSFSEYFKKEAIGYAWEFLTEVMEIPEEKLYVTVFYEDDEAFDIWNKHIGIAADRIYRFDEKDNFWAMGPTGPCGPNSEIFYDFGREYSCGADSCDVGCECDRYVEIWNLVFMQFERSEDGEMRPLPQPGIDTGMGLERISAVMQHVHSDYDIDIFKKIIENISEITGKKYTHDDGSVECVPFKVISDHLRSASFLIADGVMPSNDGRGYVLRRIIRRAVRYGDKLGMKAPFIYLLVPALSRKMGDAYPQLIEKEEFISKVLKKEEELFFSTLSQGLKILDDMLERHKEEKKEEFSGKDAFILYDTYGFPVDLTGIILKEKGFQIDMKEYKEAMKEQRERSRQNWKGNSLKMATEEYHRLLEGLGEVEFSGYENMSDESEVVYVNDDSFITRKTPFYGESGGQVGDKGKVLFSGGDSIEVIDTQKPVPGLIVHFTDRKVPFAEGEKVKLVVDQKRREAIKRHHSATHLLHHVLRKNLGAHAEQSGSYVSEERLRFDFKNMEALSDKTIAKIEKEVNEEILKNRPVSTGEYSIDDARKLGAMALFGEKYGERVRVVQMSESKELCGGTHVNMTGDIGFFKIISESSIASGIRRVEALCGLVALDFVNDYMKVINHLEADLKVKYNEIPARTHKLREDIKKLRKELDEVRLNSSVSAGRSEEYDVNGIRIRILIKSDLKGNILRESSDRLIEGQKKAVAIVLSEVNEKVMMVVKATKDATDKVHAGKLLSTIAQWLGARGGGKPTMAQGGGGNPEKIDELLNKLPEILKEKIG